MTERTFRLRDDSLTVRGLAVAAVALLMLVPVSMIRGVIDERFALHQGVVEQIGAEWGGAQTVAGPILLIPFTERWTTTETVVSANGVAKEIQRAQSRSDTLAVLPDTLTIDASLDVERRQRGIYEAMVYTSPISMKGRFVLPDWVAPKGNAVEFHWDDAVLALGVSAPVGIRQVELPALSGGARAPEPGTPLASTPLASMLLASTPLASSPLASTGGLHWRLRDAKALADGGEFEISLALNGSQQISFIPLGATTHASITSRWPHPGFVGAMPAERTVDVDGFAATWSVSSLSRSYPQVFDQAHAPASLNEISVGVRLVQPVFLYSLNDRAVKYAVLFITLTFVTLLVFELVTAARVHYVQYSLIGAALALFYLLLLALSEHIGFGWAYAIAATTVVLMITAYSAAALSGWRRALLVGAMQAATYSVLYVILRLEDYALITGTFALLVAVASLMYFTRSLARTRRTSESPTSAATVAAVAA